MILDEEGNEGIEFSVFHIKQFGQRPKRHFETISELLEAFYTEKVIREKFKEETINLNRIVESNLTRCNRRLNAQKLEAKEARNFDEYRIKGELITANLYRLKKGESQVKAINYYSPTQEEVTVKIDPALSPTENAQRFFKKYTRSKRGLAIIEERTRSTMEEIDYLESVKLGIEEAETLDNLKEIRDELIESGYIQVKKKKKDQNHKESTQRPMAFLSSDDMEILVGKNNRQNDLLTMKIASPEDYWFHVKEIPGSHVILRTRAGVEPSHDAIYEAATLAAYFSKARNSTNIPVDYTRRKNVRKPSGSKPGMVIYDKYNTIFITPDPEMLKKVSKDKSPTES
jgi:predicted ribosome quality control (RQC) complex YloA/Tae2 family protein